MAEQILFDTVQRIIETVGSLAAKEIGLLWGFENELQSLNNTVSTIEAVLLDAEEQHAAGNHQVTVWLRKLEDVIYDADDLLDAVSTEALRRQVMTHHKKAKQVRIFFSKSNQLVYRLKMAHKIKAMRERLDAIDADRERFHLKLKLSHVETGAGGNRDRDNTHSYVCAEAVIGRENDKKAVIHRLLDSNVEDNVSILPIVAIGGLGKTALAQLIINDEQIQKHFQLKMWVCVSDSFQVKNIVEKIFEAATKKKPETMEMDTLIGKLKEIIDGKKYLLVLDDVWNEDQEKWSRLKQVLMGGASGSRILVTTRSEIVARIVRTVESYPLRGLDKDDSWSLFKQMAFERGQEPEENSSIIAIGRKILAKCSGVPLAIRTIGSLLRIKNSEADWLAFNKNELSKISQNENDIVPTLKLSYDHLPSHLKRCFAYCSLFPKDSEFDKSKLIQLWMAQGFVKSSDKNSCLEDVGNEYFMDLLWRSFFQEVEIDEFGNVIGCKMHDLMHDLAISVAGSMIATFDDDKGGNVAEKTRHVSINVGDGINTSSIITSLSKASSMRTIILPIYGESDCEAIFSSFKFLRMLVLDVECLEFLPSSIGKLKHLRYLDLSWNTDLQKLSNSITRLQNLQTLILSYCQELEELPRDIKKLVNLRHLEIDYCDMLAYMPRGLGQLTNLQTLSKFVVYKDPLFRHSGGLKELNGLNNLRGRLKIENLRHGKDATSECKAANLKEKQHLDALDLRWSIELEDVISSDDIFDDEVLLEVLQPHPNLKQLRLEGNYGSRLPTWLLSLTNLVRFELVECRKCQYLPPLNQLPSLKVLLLSGMHDMEYISSGSGDSNEFSSFFPSLEDIQLGNCPNLKGWWRRRDSSVEVNSDSHNFVEITEHPLLPSFPRLSTLEILRCPLLTSMPMFPHLEQLYIENSSSKPLQQTMIMNMAAPQSPKSTATTSSSSTPLSKLKSIELVKIADLETLSPGIQHLTALQNLDLYRCRELELANDEDEMQWKGLKSLLSLKFTKLPKLVSLPLGLQHATTLQSLKISKCENLTAIPEWIHNCTSLQKLVIKGCANLTSLPEGIRSLTSLERLKIEECPILLQRCEREVGDDWAKIAHIPELKLKYPK